MNASEAIIQATAKSRPLVAPAYASDFDLDHAAIKRLAANGETHAPFIHYTHKRGTTLSQIPGAASSIYPAAGEVVRYLFGRADRSEILRESIAMADRYDRSFSLLLVQHYDGERLTTISSVEARKLARRYVLGVESEWDKEAAAARLA